MSDPRLNGTIVYNTYDTDEYLTEGADEGPTVWAATHRIENADGAWEARSIGAIFPGDTEPLVIPEPLIGEGAYAGLVAVYEATPIPGGCDANVRGYIFSAAPVPEVYTP